MKKNNTSQSFKDKWERNEIAFFKATNKEGSEISNWILNRNGWKNVQELRNFLSDKKRVLDAGCGNGRVTKLLRDNSHIETEVIGVDLVSAHVAEKNLKGYKNVFFYQKNLLNSLEDLGYFDFIYCQEVLHHTKEPKTAFNNLVKILSNGGIIAIYVYKKKAPIREFTDDFIRNIMKEMKYEDAIKLSNKITMLGKVLSEVNQTIAVPEIRELGIVEGEYSIQRFIYHFFMKCFWNNELSFQENSLVNYDWYHPEDCSRHTMEEVIGWFKEQNLEIIHTFQDFYGVTVQGRKSE